MSNISHIIATRELCRQIMDDNGIDLVVYDAVYPNKKRPDEFLVVKSIVHSDDGRPISQGAVEVCIYVANLKYGDDQSQPNLWLINDLTGIFMSGIKGASKNGVVFNDFRTMLVKDNDIRYFYQSIVIDVVS